MITKRFVGILLPLLLPILGKADLTLASIFSDHMVLQREMPVPVWGKADPGTTVTVEFAGQEKKTVANETGAWRVDLDPMPANAEPQVLQASGLRSQVSCSDVLVGEVWLCSGQSNMKRSMKRSENPEKAVADANYRDIRFYTVPEVFSTKPLDRIDAAWTSCVPKTAIAFSAVAYYFGRELYQRLDVPVGLVVSAWGGSRIDPWIPPCGFEGIESLAKMQEKINTMPVLDGDPFEDRQFPTVMYNGMIHPLIPFSIRGVIWYQGEGNHREGMLYRDKTEALLNGWRKLWGTDFPYYFVQLSPYAYGKDDPSILPEFWETQTAIVKTISNTGMAVISDYAALDNIHPPNKEVPGTRLALLALDHTYGMNVVSSGPVFQTLEKQDGGLTVTFSSAEGLTTRDGKAPDWFEIAGADGVFKPAQALIIGNTVQLSSPDVYEPLSMRFAWHKFATPNLVNAAGLPTSAFRATLPSSPDHGK